ncbi:MAG: hypothetical protein WBG46_00285 [Nonlabens sp.]
MRLFTKLPLIIFILSIASCSSDSESTQQEDREKLNRHMEIIMELSQSMDCMDESNWDFTAIGSKACGGPNGYIAYSTQIDTDDFLNRVERYTRSEADFNEKWGIISDCSLPPVPSGVTCENGVAGLIY